MIAAVSRAKHPKLFPICILKYCRSGATETTLRYSTTPHYCQRCLAWMHGLKSDDQLAREGRIIFPKIRTLTPSDRNQSSRL